jgi:hypothetical protein
VRFVRVVPLLAALAYGACARDDVRRESSDPGARASPDERVIVPRAIGGGPRAERDLVPVVEVPRAEAAVYAGAHVELAGVVVQSIASDRAFWAGPSADRQILVVFDAPALPARSASGDRDEHREPDFTRTSLVHVGQSLDIEGTLRALPTPEGARRAFHLDVSQIAQVVEQQLYVDATRLTPRSN